ncbi:hypothetical protein RND71_025240 [Anisodus tanguticus]|uniref:Uncharacterized protein n=1 Tax=Anisodus tanguticus TaxID=243964 RepID=A0AAE1RS50_9SOLA|nr:hypothetical protein RND71_025240 [Anisodus tanguticus]
MAELLKVENNSETNSEYNEDQVEIVDSHLDSRLYVVAVEDTIPKWMGLNDLSSGYNVMTQLKSALLSISITERNILATFCGPHTTTGLLPCALNLYNCNWVDTGQVFWSCFNRVKSDNLSWMQSYTVKLLFSGMVEGAKHKFKFSKDFRGHFMPVICNNFDASVLEFERLLSWDNFECVEKMHEHQIVPNGSEGSSIHLYMENGGLKGFNRLEARGYASNLCDVSSKDSSLEFDPEGKILYVPFEPGENYLRATEYLYHYTTCMKSGRYLSTMRRELVSKTYNGALLKCLCASCLDYGKIGIWNMSSERFVLECRTPV